MLGGGLGRFLSIYWTAVKIINAHISLIRGYEKIGFAQNVSLAWLEIKEVVLAVLCLFENIVPN